MVNIHQILIIQTAFIGDVVLATGILERLHQAYPHASIDFLVRKGNEGLLKQHPFLRATLVWDKKEGKWKDWWRLRGLIRGNEYDMVVNVQRFGATGLWTATSGAPIRIGYDKNPFSAFFTHRVPHIVSTENSPIHEINRCHALIADFVQGDQPAKPRLYPSSEDELAVSPYLNAGPFITIAPASVWFTKQYPASKWRRFMEHVPMKYRIFLLGAPGDAALCDEIALGFSPDQVQSLAGKFNFLQSAALMKRAHMNYVNDSAPMHFASSVDAPVTAIYCSTIPAFGFGPLSTQQHIVESPIPLACRPCGLHGKAACPESHFRCAMNIQEQQLIDTL
jgi:ADP-heptose:LPS heptosyltransferase